MRDLLNVAVLYGSMVLATPALAATAPQATNPSADLAAIPAGKYVIDPTHTNVLFRIAHLGFSGYLGRFNTIEGTVELDPKALDKSRLEVAIDPASIDTNNSKLETELRDAAFEVGKFKVITFKATKLTQTDATHGTIVGDLTLHGVTKPVTLSVTLNGAGPHPMNKKPTIGFSATGMMKRSEFGIMNWLPMVSDDVQLIIEAELQQAS
ncbi:MAG: YceI family protein [Alphaproteobacteria bacterium]